VRQYIGALMSPAPVGNADQAKFANNFFFVFGPPLLLVQGATVRQKEWRNIRKMLVFGASHLFSYQLQETEMHCRKDNGPIIK
jgi:hypothetical protein